VDPRLIQELELLHDRICMALGDSKRLMILYLLSQGPRNVTALAQELGVPQSTVSRHLHVLRERGLVETQRENTSVIYSLADARLIEAMDLLRGVLRDRVLHQAYLVEPSHRESDTSNPPE
jgi:DNA-binding transcriptional ArsR family regulator